MPRTSCKLRVAALLCAPLLFASACSVLPRTVWISAAELERAAAIEPPFTAFALACDAAPLRERWCALGPRLALLEVRSAEEWNALRSATEGLPDCPDFARGAVIAIVSRAGRPISGDWPIRIESVRELHGGGLVTAHFEGGTYLPDGSTYLSLVQVPGLQNVLIVEVNGVRFYPG